LVIDPPSAMHGAYLEYARPLRQQVPQSRPGVGEAEGKAQIQQPLGDDALTFQEHTSAPWPKWSVRLT
jgi:hypothetical protein